MNSSGGSIILNIIKLLGVALLLIAWSPVLEAKKGGGQKQWQSDSKERSETERERWKDEKESWQGADKDDKGELREDWKETRTTNRKENLEQRKQERSWWQGLWGDEE